MSNKSIRSLLQSLRIGGEAGKSNTVLAVRLVVAAILLAVSLLVKMPAAARIVLLVVSLLAAGYDLVLDAVNSVEKKD